MSELRTRIESIDEFRGFAILLMVLADYLAGPAIVPAWLKHAPDIGLTEADVVAPLFILAIGLTFGLSWRKRRTRDGTKAATWHAATRYLALVGIGALLTALGNASGIVVDPSNWGLLQTIGTAGLASLLLINLPPLVRSIAALAMLATYQVLLDTIWLTDVLRATHGGLKGALSWAAMMVLATALGDLFHDEPRRKRFLGASVGFLFAGLILSVFVSVSKHRVSASYVLLTLGGSGVTFWLFHVFEGNLGWIASFLGIWGRNPLVLYILHGLLLGILTVPTNPGWYTGAPAWLVVAQAVLMVGALSVIGWALDRRGITFTV